MKKVHNVYGVEALLRKTVILYFECFIKAKAIILLIF
jgi:hypothetical protein